MSASKPRARKLLEAKRATCCAWCSAARAGASAEKLFEDVAEVAHALRVFDADARPGPPGIAAASATPATLLRAAELLPGIRIPPARLPSRPHAGMAKLVVVPAFSRLRQDIIRFLNLEEALGRFLVVFVDIGMVFADELAMRFLDFIRACGARHPKNFVVITFGHVGRIVAVRTASGKRAALSSSG